MLMPAALGLEIVGFEGLVVVEKCQEVAIRHLEKKMAVLRSIIAERIVCHHRVDERQTEKILVEFPGLFGIATAKRVMVNVQQGIAASGFLNGSVILCRELDVCDRCADPIVVSGYIFGFRHM